MKHLKPTKAFSLIELAVVVLLIGLVTLVALNGKTLVIKANCTASSFGSKNVNDNLDNSAELTKNQNSTYETCVNNAMGIATVNAPTNLCSGVTCTSCKTLLDANPGTASGTYKIDPDGTGGVAEFDAYCDMTTDSGGWTLVLNYLHKGGTNPALNVRTSNLPVLGLTTLGTDESLPTTTTSQYWGHSSRNLLNKFTFTEVRFYGKTSNPNNGGANNRTLHFKTSLSNCLTFFKSGTGNCSGLNTSFTALSSHSAYLPGQANSYNGLGTPPSDYEFTYMPFFAYGPGYHWAINAGNRWSMDDQPDGQGSGYQYDTHHQAWIR